MAALKWNELSAFFICWRLHISAYEWMGDEIIPPMFWYTLFADWMQFRVKKDPTQQLTQVFFYSLGSTLGCEGLHSGWSCIKENEQLWECYPISHHHPFWRLEYQKLDSNNRQFIFYVLQALTTYFHILHNSFNSMGISSPLNSFSIKQNKKHTFRCFHFGHNIPFHFM